MVNFEIIATLKAVKDSDNFSAFEVRDFNSGWQNTRYRFNAISGTNRFRLEISGGKWIDDKKNQILTFSRAEAGKKPEKMTVKWEDRKNPEIIDKVAGYRIYTCNLLTFDERKALEEDGKEDDKDKDKEDDKVEDDKPATDDSKDEEAEDEDKDKDESPATGDAWPVVAVMLFAMAAALLAVLRKKQLN